MRARRQEVDLQEIKAQDLYGNKKDQFGAEDDDMFGGDGMDDFLKATNEPAYARMNNGMGVNSNATEIKKQN